MNNAIIKKDKPISTGNILHLKSYIDKINQIIYDANIWELYTSTPLEKEIDNLAEKSLDKKFSFTPLEKEIDNLAEKFLEKKFSFGIQQIWYIMHNIVSQDDIFYLSSFIDDPKVRQYTERIIHVKQFEIVSHRIRIMMGIHIMLVFRLIYLNIVLENSVFFYFFSVFITQSAIWLDGLSEMSSSSMGIIDDTMSYYLLNRLMHYNVMVRKFFMRIGLIITHINLIPVNIFNSLQNALERAISLIITHINLIPVNIFNPLQNALERAII